MGKREEKEAPSVCTQIQLIPNPVRFSIWSANNDKDTMEFTRSARKAIDFVVKMDACPPRCNQTLIHYGENNWIITTNCAIGCDL